MGKQNRTVNLPDYCWKPPIIQYLYLILGKVEGMKWVGHVPRNGENRKANRKSK